MSLKEMLTIIEDKIHSVRNALMRSERRDTRSWITQLRWCDRAERECLKKRLEHNLWD
jgi:hypothetical protein